MKSSIFLKILWKGCLTATILLCAGQVKAQWRDDFANGLDSWHGDKQHFECRNGTLWSKGPDKASRLGLSRNVSLFSDSACCLEYGLDLQFIPSTTNFLRLYLICDDTLLHDAARALYLHLGQKSGKNYWQLWQSGPDSSTMLWQGATLLSKQSQMKMQVRCVFRPVSDSAGRQRTFFSLYYTFENDAYADWILDGDSLPLPEFMPDTDIFYAGMVCSYKTASRATMYGFTHIYAGFVSDFYWGGGSDDAGSHGDGTGFDKFLDSLSRSVPHYGSVVINEVMFDPSTGESRYAELYNRSDSLFEMKHWALAVPDGDGGWKYHRLFAEGEHIFPGYTYRVPAKEARKVALDSRQACRENIFTAKSFPTLDKQGRIRLVWMEPDTTGGTVFYRRDTRDTIVLDEIAYAEESHHWLVSDTKGVALERLRSDVSGLEKSNWMSAAETAGYATPGCENSHAYPGSLPDDGDYFVLNPPLVTPNNDGVNDFTVISWDARLDGFVCTISVYDAAGRKINQLCSKRLLGAGGTLRYDAVDADGRILRPGIYVLLIELIKPDGKIKRLRYPLGVG